MMIFGIVIGAICCVALIGTAIWWRLRFIKRIDNQHRALLNQSQPVSVHEFLNHYEDLKTKAKMTKTSIKNYDSAGIYIIHNQTKQCYYVGQSIHVLHRVKNHFSGKGNGDVYADFKYNNSFTVQIIKCSQFELDAIEKYYIKYFNAYHAGYNKTRGNH